MVSSAKAIEEISKKLEQPWGDILLAWYDEHKRPLPWRENKDPYRIWVSEVMCQQTRVEAVKPYFETWLNLFPTPEALAMASEDEVLRAWQGLGYYSRARNLQAGARELLEKYNGQMPRDRKAVEGLKGIGAYTAGAILSIAYNLPEPAVDGNVMRVFARLYNLEGDILKSSTRKEVTKLVEQVMPQERPGDFNEALMDFGATVCIPKSPRCENCPLKRICLAYATERTQELPIRMTKKEVPTTVVTVGLVSKGNAYLLHRRPDKGLLRGMWEFPSVEGDTVQLEALESLVQKNLGEAVSVSWHPVTELTHVFSHRRWDMRVFYGELAKGSAVLGAYEEAETRQAMGVHESFKENEYNEPLGATHKDERQGVDIERKTEAMADGSTWRLVKPEDFTLLPWAGPHGKLTVHAK